MFYAHFVLSKKGPFSRIWLAAHWDKKLTRAHVFETNINSSVDAILEPKLKMALRTSGHLLLGVVRIYSRKAKYLLADCNEIYVKIKTSFRPGVVDLPDESNREAALAAITLPENMQDYEATMADLTAINLNTMAINLSRPEDITMNEDVCDINLGRQDDDFGDTAFEELPSREMLRDGGVSAYDSVYGRATDASGRFSVRDSDRPSIRPDLDGDDTLIGGDSHHGDKMSKGVHPSIVDDMDLDDEPFPDYGPDSNGSFGGEIDHNLFNSPNLFEDPSAHKQLDQIASAFDTHVGDLGLSTEIEKERHGEKDGTGDHHITSIAAEVLALHDQHQQQNGPLQHEESERHQQGHTPLHQQGQPMHSMTSMRRDNITLLSNESEAFALQPIDVTATISEPRRAVKRKRRLIIDESKSIPSELMKIQMQDTVEITTQLDLAPPTKRLMHMKETGGLYKLFTLPGRAIPSRVLQRLFTRNLQSHLPLPEEAQEDVSGISAIYIPTSDSMSGIEQQDLTSSGAATPRDFLRTPSTVFPTGLQMTTLGGDTEIHGGLHAIPEGLEELDETISGERSRFPSVSVNIHHQHSPTRHVEHSLHDPFLAAPTRPTDIPEHHSVTSDNMDDDENDQNFSLIDMAPASVLSEASHEMIGGLEQELAARDPHRHHDDMDMNASFGADGGGGYEDDDDEPAEPAVFGEVDEADEIIEERRLEKRSKDMLRRLRAHTAVHGWGENGLSMTAMCEGNTKKQAASKFYTALLLRKQGSILLSQDAPFSDIRILRGPSFVGPGGPNFEP